MLSVSQGRHLPCMVLFDVTSSGSQAPYEQHSEDGYAPGDMYLGLDAVLRLGLGDPTTVGEDQR